MHVVDEKRSGYHNNKGSWICLREQNSQGMVGANLLSPEHFCRLPYVILMDLEFTCWEDSLRTGWANPGRPPEVLEVGLVAYDLQRDKAIDAFQSYVKPAINSTLPSYCKDLLRISQKTIDQSPPLKDVAEQIYSWLAQRAIQDVPTCSWGEEDRRYWDEDSRRNNCVNPFSASYYIDLAALSYDLLGISKAGPLEREEIRKIMGIPVTTKRHSALADALDLICFCTALQRKAGEAGNYEGLRELAGMSRIGK